MQYNDYVLTGRQDKKNLKGTEMKISLKKEAYSLLQENNNPLTVKDMATKLAGDPRVSNYYTKYPETKELINFLKVSISSSSRSWKEVVYEHIDGVKHLKYVGEGVDKGQEVKKPNKKTKPTKKETSDKEVEFLLNGRVYRSKVLEELDNEFNVKFLFGKERLIPKNGVLRTYENGVLVK